MLERRTEQAKRERTYKKIGGNKNVPKALRASDVIPKKNALRSQKISLLLSKATSEM